MCRVPYSPTSATYAGGEQRGGIRLNQDRRSDDLVTSLQPASIVTRRIDRAAVIKRCRTPMEEGAIKRLAAGFFDPVHFEGRHILPPDDAKRDQLDFTVLEMIAVVETMLVMKARNDIPDICARERTIGHAGSQLEALAVITTLRKSLEFLAIAGHAVCL
jgi:hypothetical protein